MAGHPRLPVAVALFATVAFVALVLLSGSGSSQEVTSGEPQPVTEGPPSAGTTPPAPSRAVGLPHRGRLIGGILLAPAGETFLTWDPVLDRTPNRAWRRWGTDRLLQTVLGVIADYRAADPAAPRVVIGDLSRRRGGPFGKRFGGLGHASHQNGLDADVYYPRKDGLEVAPESADQVDRRRAQELVDRFVAAGAEYVFVGPNLRLRGPRQVVRPLVHHDDHLHVRIPNGRQRNSRPSR